MADLTTFATGAMAYFRGLPADEKAAKAELAALEAQLGPAREASLKATEARRAMRMREALIENEVQAMKAELAGLRADDPKGQPLAVRIIQLQGELTGVRGSMVGEALIVGKIDELLQAENRALSARQELERQVAAARDRVDGIRRLRESDAGRDTDQLRELGMLPPAIKVERYAAENAESGNPRRIA